jgi:hypothetical protein
VSGVGAPDAREPPSPSITGGSANARQAARGLKRKAGCLSAGGQPSSSGWGPAGSACSAGSAGSAGASASSRAAPPQVRTAARRPPAAPSPQRVSDLGMSRVPCELLRVRATEAESFSSDPKRSMRYGSLCIALDFNTFGEL